MAYSNAEARQQLLDTLAAATEDVGRAVAYLSEAYEQLDEMSADRLEEELFRPVQAAYARARRTHDEFADRHGLSGRSLDAAHPSVREHDAKGIIDHAVAAVGRADSTLATLQDSMLPVEVGDPQLRAGLEQVRVALGAVPSRARAFTRVLGR